jgi:AbrB family looped-hinge helix DNA binding protein
MKITRMMKTTRLSSKGQLVVPSAVRKSQSWKAGTQLAIEQTDDGIFLKTLRPFPPTTIDEVFGALKYRSKRKTIAQMNQAYKKEVRKRHARGRY